MDQQELPPLPLLLYGVCAQMSSEQEQHQRSNEMHASDLPDNCEEHYYSTCEGDRPRVLLAMAIGVYSCDGMMRIALEDVHRKPRKEELYGEVKRRCHVLGVPRTLTSGSSAEELKNWLLRNPIQNRKCIEFLRTTIEATIFGLDQPTALGTIAMSCQQTCETASTRGKAHTLLLCMAIGINSIDDLRRRALADPTIKSPCKKHLVAEATRRINFRVYEGLPAINERPVLSWHKQRLVTWLENHPIRNPNCLQYVKGRLRDVVHGVDDQDLHLHHQQDDPQDNDDEGEQQQQQEGDYDQTIFPMMDNTLANGTSVGENIGRAVHRQISSSSSQEQSMTTSLSREVVHGDDSDHDDGGGGGVEDELSERLETITVGSLTVGSGTVTPSILSTTSATQQSQQGTYGSGEIMSTTQTSSSSQGGSGSVTRMSLDSSQSGRRRQILQRQVPQQNSGGEQPQLANINDTSRSSNGTTRGRIKKGRLKDANGVRGQYVGQCSSDRFPLFKRAKPHGRGVMTYEDQTAYDGNWEHGHWSGFGYMNLSNGGTFRGLFSESAFNGKGVLTTSQGDVFEGEWIRHHKTNDYGVIEEGYRFRGSHRWEQEQEQQRESLSDYYFSDTEIFGV